MGGPKAELVLDGRRLVDRAVAALTDGGCRPVIAVVRDGVDVPGATTVVNPDPERGMRSSLHLAVAAAGSVPLDALAVALVDLPGMGPDAVRSVLAGWRPGRIAVADYQGRRGHPIVMGLDDWRMALASAGPDEGARALISAQSDRVDLIAVGGDPSDLDTVDDLSRWRS